MTTTSHTNEPSNRSGTSSAAAILRSRFSDRRSSIVVSPGVYDELSARIALSLGFETLYLINPFALHGPRSEAGSLYSDRYGLHTQTEAAATLSHSLAAISRDAAIMTDADTAYGGPAMIKRTIQLHQHSNVAATHIDDRNEKPRQGLARTDLLLRSEYEARIQAAVDAREEGGNKILIIVRTFALDSYGWDEAMERMNIARNLGADAGFLNGVRTRREAVEAAHHENFPMIYMEQGALFPPLTISEAQDMGYAAILFPLASISPAYSTISKSLEMLKHKGGDSQITSSLAEINEHVGLGEDFMHLVSGR